ncbi:unnamed protein product [Sphenostylis stenocarpa]|uniref:Uncharacterized protein n=1 Tax=Sphenostylis stenocarpa TaxID=92480 RepID=A0AA86VMB3_9FABA|nr:unnamed protein product [Sphenostylis stenocarpa]
MDAKEEAENREDRKGIGMMEEWPTRCDSVEIEVAVKAVMFFLCPSKQAYNVLSQEDNTTIKDQKNNDSKDIHLTPRNDKIPYPNSLSLPIPHNYFKNYDDINTCTSHDAPTDNIDIPFVTFDNTNVDILPNENDSVVLRRSICPRKNPT